jgi:phosphoglycolate phosphatase-like HAD superfamily hydrolase
MGPLPATRSLTGALTYVSLDAQMTDSDKRLLLWDIDSTLIDSAHAGMKSLKRVVATRFAVEDDLHDIEVAGRTDANIARSILAKYGVAPTPEKVADFLDDYLAGLAELLPQTNGRVLRAWPRSSSGCMAVRIACWRC